MQDSDQNGAAARLSTTYIVGVLCEVLHTSELDILDVLITMTVGSANTAPQRVASRLVSDSDGRRGISRNAVSRTINVPLETVRRRVSSLIERKVLEEREDGLVVSAGEGLAGNLKIASLNAHLLRQLYRGLKAQGVRLE